MHLYLHCIDLYRLKLEVSIITKIDKNSQCSTVAYLGNLSLRLHLGKREENLYSTQTQ